MYNNNPFGGGFGGNPFGRGLGGFGGGLPFGGTPVFGGPQGLAGKGQALMQLAYQNPTPNVPTTPPPLDPMPVPGMPSGMGGAPEGGGGLGGILKGWAGDALGGVGDFLTGNDGANALGLINVLGGIYGDRRAHSEYKRQQERQEGREDELNERYDSWAPERMASIERFRERLGR
jgi:hypothetical protein